MRLVVSEHVFLQVVKSPREAFTRGFRVFPAQRSPRTGCPVKGCFSVLVWWCSGFKEVPYFSAVGFEGNKISTAIINVSWSVTEIPPCTAYQNAVCLGSLPCGDSNFPWHRNAFTIIFNFLSANAQRIPCRETI